MDQRALVEAARKGDHDAFAVLAERALARLDAVARLILRDAELARDAVQEAMVKAWRDLPGLRDPDNWDAWLHRITANSAIEAARRRFADALASLEPEQRALVVLRYYVGMSVPDAAATLGIPLGTAKSRLHRSLTHMRDVVTTPSDGARTSPTGELR